VLSANTDPIAVVAARGGRRSAADSNVIAPASWAKEAPNMLSADSSGDRVAV
jgi:hypothetical protein